VPPLRERIEDIAELANYFLFRFDRELGLDLRGFAPEVLERFQVHPWPGNVRELQGVIKQAMFNASGHLILPEFLPEHLTQPASVQVAACGDTDAGDPSLSELVERLLPRAEGRLHEEAVAALERVLFPRVLRHTQGHQGRASELLGLNRSTLRHRLRTLGLTPERPELPSTDSAPDSRKGTPGG
jgi:DNA-binding NtrC family response regulator